MMMLRAPYKTIDTRRQSFQRLVRSSDIQHVRRPAPQAHAEAQHNRMFMACASSNDGDTSPTASDPTYDLDDLGTAKNALDLGLGLCKEERWAEALSIFEKALTLPGTGLKRFRDKPRTISDGERMAALYNIACCHAKLNDPRTGLVALAGCLEAGYEDFNQCRSDPDLAALRADSRFAELMLRFEPKKPQGFFGGLFQGFKS